MRYPHLHQIRRNAPPNPQSSDFIRVAKRFRQWAETTHGVYEARDKKGHEVPRLQVRDALRIAQWWHKAIKTTNVRTQFGGDAHSGLYKMLIAATHEWKPKPTDPRQALQFNLEDPKEKAQLDNVLMMMMAEFFWEGVSLAAVNMGAARLEPTLLTHLEWMSDSIRESVDELPGRIKDAAGAIGDLATDLAEPIVTPILKAAAAAGITLLSAGAAWHFIRTKRARRSQP